MAQLNFWNKFYLHGSKIVLLLLVLGINFQNSYAQNNGKTKNLANHDDQTLHFGFYLALNSNSYRVVQSDYFVQLKDTLRSISAPWTGGANVGFVVNLRLAEYMDLRALPGFTFTQRSLDYVFNTVGQESTVTQIFENTYVELPFCLKMKSARRGNHRMYILAGGKMSIATNIKKKNVLPDNVRLVNYGYAFEYGVGIDIYNQMFKLAPEIRISHGLNNMAVADQFVYSKAIDKLFMHTVTLVFNFE